MVQAIVGVLGTLIAALIGAAVALRTRGPRFVKPELVDVSFTRSIDVDPAADSVAVSLRSDPKGQIPVLDVKLRNPGEQPIFVIRALLEIIDAQVLPAVAPPVAPKHEITATEIVSYTYDIELPVPGSAKDLRVTHDLSQVIPPTDVDRFQIRLGVADYGHTTGPPEWASILCIVLCYASSMAARAERLFHGHL